MEVLPTLRSFILDGPKDATYENGTTQQHCQGASLTSRCLVPTIQAATRGTANTLAIQNLQGSAVLPSSQVIWMAVKQGTVRVPGNLTVFTQRC